MVLKLNYWLIKLFFLRIKWFTWWNLLNSFGWIKWFEFYINSTYCWTPPPTFAESPPANQAPEKPNHRRPAHRSSSWPFSSSLSYAASSAEDARRTRDVECTRSARPAAARPVNIHVKLIDHESDSKLKIYVLRFQIASFELLNFDNSKSKI